MKVTEAVHQLILRAEKETDATDALKWSQAACNAANALCALKSFQQQD